MRRYLINLVLFFAIVGVIDLGIGIIGDYLQSHAKGGVSKEFNDLVCKSNHDILFLGSSRAHHHYDTPFLTDTLGVDVYNAGYDGNGVVLADGILNLILEHSSPKLVLFDVEPAFDITIYKNDNNHKRYISSLKPYFRRPAIGKIIKDVSKEEWCKVHSGMLRYNSVFVSMLIDNAIPRKMYYRGFAPLVGEIRKEPEPMPVEPYQIDQFKLDYVEHLIDLAQSHNVPIAFVASPKYGNHDTSVLEPVKQICERKDVPFLDYYNQPDFMNHKDWFKEPMHLNATGARVFSRTMVGEIEELMEGRCDSE